MTQRTAGAAIAIGRKGAKVRKEQQQCTTEHTEREREQKNKENMVFLTART